MDDVYEINNLYLRIYHWYTHCEKVAPVVYGHSCSIRFLAGMTQTGPGRE